MRYICGMKVKTSITLEKDLIAAIDKKAGEYGSRSEFIEVAARHLLARLLKDQQEQRDLEIINRRARKLNQEAADVLDYQVAT